VLPCVDVFVADEYFVWVPILRTRLALRLGAHLANSPCVAFGRPSCGRALRCVGAPNLRTCLAFALRTCVGAPNLRTCLALRWGAQLADVPCVAFGRPSCGRALRCVGAPNLGEAVLKKSTSKPKFVLIHPPARLSAECSLVWTFSLRMSFSFGRPSCELALRCVWVPILRTCLALRWGAQLADVPWGRALGRPTCGRALLCVGAPNLRTCLALRLGAHLADAPCVAFGCPTLVRPY
jgi:hypothetical protein